MKTIELNLWLFIFLKKFSVYFVFNSICFLLSFLWVFLKNAEWTKIEFFLILLFLFLKNKELFYFNGKFLVRFIKIIIASILMGLFFNFLLDYFQNELSFDKTIKSL